MRMCAKQRSGRQIRFTPNAALKKNTVVSIQKKRKNEMRLYISNQLRAGDLCNCHGSDKVFSYFKDLSRRNRPIARCTIVKVQV